MAPLLQSLPLGYQEPLHGLVLARGLRASANPKGLSFPAGAGKKGRRALLAKVHTELGTQGDWSQSLIPSSLSQDMVNWYISTGLLSQVPWCLESRVQIRPRDHGFLGIAMEENLRWTLWDARVPGTDPQLYKLLSDLMDTRRRFEAMEYTQDSGQGRSSGGWARDSQGNILCSKLGFGGLALEGVAFIVWRGNWASLVSQVRDRYRGKSILHLSPWPYQDPRGLEGGVLELRVASVPGVDEFLFLEEFAWALGSVVDCVDKIPQPADDHGRMWGTLLWGSGLQEPEVRECTQKVLIGESGNGKLGLGGGTCLCLATLVNLGVAQGLRLLRYEVGQYLHSARR